MRHGKLTDIMRDEFTASSLWEEECKIPWNDAAFSRRMLAEHLNQDHELASRTATTIEEQVRWLADFMKQAGGARILDLGCGPGLYAPGLAGFCERYVGIDFGPASIEYAKARFEAPGTVDFLLGDVRSVSFGGPHDLIMMLYGEINVFSPRDCRRILARAHGALAPGGRLVLEFQTIESLRELGRSASWHKAGQGLFLDAPHLCLTENRWIEKERAVRQLFHVIELETAGLATYCSVTKAWTVEELSTLLREAGFLGAEMHEGWPAHNDGLRLLSAVKP